MTFHVGSRIVRFQLRSMVWTPRQRCRVRAWRFGFVCNSCSAHRPNRGSSKTNFLSREHRLRWIVTTTYHNQVGRVTKTGYVVFLQLCLLLSGSCISETRCVRVGRKRFLAIILRRRVFAVCLDDVSSVGRRLGMHIAGMLDCVLGSISFRLIPVREEVEDEE